MKITERLEYAEAIHHQRTEEDAVLHDDGTLRTVSDGRQVSGEDWVAADSLRATRPSGGSYLEGIQASTTACAEILGLARVQRLLSSAVDDAWGSRRDVDPRTRSARALNWPTISHPREVEGTDLDKAEADRKFWAVGVHVRRDRLPLLVAERGVIVRAWSVRDWVLDPVRNLYSAELGERLDADDIEMLGCPVTFGDRIPVTPQRPYWPLLEDVDGTCYLAGSEIDL